jgi:hypothetical protein
MAQVDTSRRITSVATTATSLAFAMLLSLALDSRWEWVHWY